MFTSVNTLQKAEKKLVIDYSIEEAKKAILIVFNTNVGKFTVWNDTINDAFNTYHFGMANNINPAIIDISLSKVEDKKTEINISVTNTYGARSSNSVLEGVLNRYLQLLGGVLQNGVSNYQAQSTAAPKGAGCLVVGLLLIASIVLMSFAIIG